MKVLDRLAFMWLTCRAGRSVFRTAFIWGLLRFFAGWRDIAPELSQEDIDATILAGMASLGLEEAA